uniref:Uncharacterized protein n=1 Tax=Setaria italica TaxID=4555 RepID=K4A1Y4_SETIT
MRHSHRQVLAAAREEVREEMVELAELKVSELEAKRKQEECRERAEEVARVANDARVSAEASARRLQKILDSRREILDLREVELLILQSAQVSARIERDGWAKAATEALQALLKMNALGDLGFKGITATSPGPVDSLGLTFHWLRKAAQATPKVAERYGSICARAAMNLALILLHSGGCTHLGSVARPDMSFLTDERFTAEVREASKGFYRNVWECF